MALNTNQVLQQRYRIVAPLGQGGMGAVYRAWDTRLNIPVALKEMTAQPGLEVAVLAHLRAQFQQEASTLARLDHPHLVDVTDFFEEGGNTYLVMKYIEGESLAERIEREGAQSEGLVLEWASQLLSALGYCHSQGIIHRDVKPQNVILHPDGRAILVDFGLVKLWDPHDPRTKTAMRGMGTPEYAPLEQYDAASGHTDPRSDIYSLGATLYHALTGQAPPTATQQVVDPKCLAPIQTAAPGTSADMALVVSRAMELRPVDRFQSAQEMAGALQGTASTPASPAPPLPTKVLPVATPSAQAEPKLVALAPKGRGGSAALPWYRRVPRWALPVSVLALVALVVGIAVTIGMARTQLPSNAALGDTETRPADGMVMVHVPAGEFEMGSTVGNSDEEPVHTVALDSYWIDQTEVTNAQYAQCVAAGDCDPPSASISKSRNSYYGNSAYDDYPVIYVSWDDAVAYCEWAGGRLPTEAEWEYAARGSERSVFPWGDVFDGTRLNYCDAQCGSTFFYSWADEAADDGYADTAPVGSYPAGASWVGALDMAGNVWEWIADWYGEYPSGRQENPAGPPSGEYRAVRGGSWGNDPSSVRCALRNWDYPGQRYDVSGFRCARGY